MTDLTRQPVLLGMSPRSSIDLITKASSEWLSQVTEHALIKAPNLHELGKEPSMATSTDTTVRSVQKVHAKAPTEQN